MFNKNDPLIDSVTKVMQENQVRRDAEKAVNEELGIHTKRALPFELHKLYDQLLEEVIQEALNEKLVGNQHKIDVNKNNRVDAHDFKLLRAKKEKKPEEHGVEAEREMASKGKKMYEENLKEKRGLWDNIHAKRKRIAAGSGEKMRKPGSEGAPTEKDSKAAQNEEAIEQIDELSPATIKSYHQKATGIKRGGENIDDRMTNHAYAADDAHEAGKKSLARYHEKKLNDLDDRYRKRGDGIDRAEKRLGIATPVKKVNEVAPPSDKAERMVKYIKKGYSKDGELSKKEKSIAYATAWKAYNKGKAKD